MKKTQKHDGFHRKASGANAVEQDKFTKWLHNLCTITTIVKNVLEQGLIEWFKDLF